MNAFSGYVPQLSAIERGKGKNQTTRNRKMTPIYLPGSLVTIPSRDSINTETRKPADKTRFIQRAGI
jgi:hypothetical protein